MYFDDHEEPHFHAEYGEHKAKFRIDPPGIIAGSLPGKAAALVMEWLLLHQQELREAYARAERAEPPGKILPLE